MKRRTEFKGYTTQVEFDAVTGSFRAEPVDHGFSEVAASSTIAKEAEKRSAVIIQKPATKKTITEPVRRKTSAFRTATG